MNRFLLFLIFCPAKAFGQRYSPQARHVYSEIVKDSFELYISTPASYDSTRPYGVVYYCDANLKSGKLLREMIKEDQYASMVSKTIFVGVGHIGDYHVLRRRDFIFSSIKGRDTANTGQGYGQTERFYRFLKEELIPMIDVTYRTNRENNSIVGHSLGGLFVFYCLFKNDSLFRNFLALSPSLWVDHYGIFSFDKLASSLTTPKRLYFSAGGLEVLNRIKRGADDMANYLDAKNYSNLTYRYQVHKGETHNSQVEHSWKYLLTGKE
ncbi:MAG TPA: alpha/beta hydrolase-fold protein [Flavisolibacter sp.]|nr:alpha/beta hydrolase-fold protein [Flavisolibacter sp.]